MTNEITFKFAHRDKVPIIEFYIGERLINCMMLKLGVFYDYLLAGKKKYDGDWMLTINFTENEVDNLKKLLNDLCAKDQELGKLFDYPKKQNLMMKIKIQVVMNLKNPMMNLKNPIMI